MALTVEQETAVKEAVKLALEEAEKNKPNRKVTGGDGKASGQWTGGDPALLSDPKGGFKSFSHFAQDIYKSGPNLSRPTKCMEAWTEVMNKTLKEDDSGIVGKTAGYMEEGDSGQGGALVPVEFRAQLLMNALEDSIVLKNGAVRMPMATNRLQIPAIVDSTHATGTTFGGVTIYRTAELGAKTPTKPALGKVELTLHSLTGLVYVSEELMEDSPISLEALLNAMFASSIAFVQDDDFLNGSGVNQALGVFNTGNPSLIAVTKATNQAANTILAENIIQMWSQLYARGQNKAVWVANNECFPQLAQMSLAVGTGGIPVYLPSNGLAGSPNGSLMGRPLILSEKMQALGTQGDIGLADFSQYLVGDKGGIKTASSIHLKFDYDAIAFRFVLRYDGQPWWLSALTPRRGSNTLSPFVVLAVRS